MGLHVNVKLGVYYTMRGVLNYMICTCKCKMRGVLDYMICTCKCKMRGVLDYEGCIELYDMYM